MKDHTDAGKIAVELCLKIVAKCVQCRGSMIMAAACQDDRCPLHACGPSVALLDIGGYEEGPGHANSD